MPLSPRYGDELKSGLADMSNMGRSREGGAQIGAKFLEAFVAEKPWVHLDIAGTHDLSGPAAAAAHGVDSGEAADAVVSGRAGAVLGASCILKEEPYPGVHSSALPVMHEKAPNFRQVRALVSTGVCTRMPLLTLIY
jgi:hypothetical protein